MKNPHILIADGDHTERARVTEFLEKQGYRVSSARNGSEACCVAQSKEIDAVLACSELDDMSGLELLKEIKALEPETVVFIHTERASVSDAVQAMKYGAEDYLTKPLDIEQLDARLLKILGCRHGGVAEEAEVPDRDICRFGAIVGKSESMERVFRLIEKIADSDSTVIIYGESGTGKELAARAIHSVGRRSRKPLVPVNCGAIPEELLESELFGHEKGAFTGAHRHRVGRFELADGGTIFLDEIGDMSPNLQVKILRVLQEHEFERVGGVKSIRVNIRVIAATHRNLEKAVEDGKFREDLYYRLNVIPLYLPPLRERKSDIPLLMSYFINRLNHKKGSDISGASEQALECFLRYDWPGNVRELQNMIERLAVLKGTGTIDSADLPDKILGSRSGEQMPVVELAEGGASFSTMVTGFEKHLIQQALKKTSGVKNKAAKLLNMNRTTLVEKMKKLKIKYNE